MQLSTMYDLEFQLEVTGRFDTRTAGATTPPRPGSGEFIEDVTAQGLWLFGHRLDIPQAVLDHILHDSRVFGDVILELEADAL